MDKGMASVEPWLSGTHNDVDAVVRAVLHALELAGEDVEKWCAGLTDDEINCRPFGLAPLAFHLRHIARSLDRLLSYAEGTQLDGTQKVALRTELDGGATRPEVTAELSAALIDSMKRVRAFSPELYNETRSVGRAMLPTTVAGLLVHCADHTQRHVGQAVTTAKLLVGMRA
jgi:DinB superfamily